MANNKSLLNSSFKDTIKMTLTTDGNLGVGLINPNYKITATGVIQSKSILGYVVNDFPWKVGLDTWKDDVHLSLGVSNDGLNTGVIQVTGGDTSFNGTAFVDSPYNLNLQPGGGNVGIGIQGNPGYPLQVQGEIKTNTIVRADVDFTTGTDTPGWQYYPAGWVEGNTATQMPATDITTVTNYQIWHQGPSLSWGTIPTDAGNGAKSNYRRFLKYKIIGKTVHLSFLFSNIEALGSHEGFIVKLPSFLRPATGDINYHPRDKSGFPGLNVLAKIQTGRALYDDHNYNNPDDNVYTKEMIVRIAKVTNLASNEIWGTNFVGSAPYTINPNLQDFCLVMHSVFNGAASNNHVQWLGGYSSMLEEGVFSPLSRRFFDGTGSFSSNNSWIANSGYGDLGSYIIGSITYDLL